MRSSSVSLPPRGGSASSSSFAPAAAGGGGSYASAYSDDVLLEVPLRAEGLQRFEQRLSRAGLRTVRDLRQRGRLLPAMMPVDVAERLAEACGLPAESLRDPPTQRSTRGGQSAASLGDAHDAVWSELRQYEEEAEQRLRQAASRYTGVMIGTPGRSLKRHGCSAKPRRSEADVVRSAVDRAQAELALARSGLRGLRELRELESQAPQLSRTGKTMEPARQETMTTLNAHVQDVLQALALKRRQWRNAGVDAVELGGGGGGAQASSSAFFGATSPSSATFGQASSGSAGGVGSAQQALESAMRAEIGALRKLLKENGVDASSVKAAPANVDEIIRDRNAKRAASSAALGSSKSIALNLGMADWIDNQLKLPVTHAKDDAARRKVMFRDFDPNGNGYLSLAEIDKGARDVLKLPALFGAKPVLLMAYQQARDTVGPGGSRSRAPQDLDGDGDIDEKDRERAELNSSYVERREFRILLLYIAAYFDMWLLFNRIDSAGGGDDDDDDADAADKKASESADRLITEGELAAAFDDVAHGRTPTDESGANNNNNLARLFAGVTAAEAFKNMNTDGGSKVSFREFAAWALKRLRALAKERAGRTSEGPVDGEEDGTDTDSDQGTTAASPSSMRRPGSTVMDEKDNVGLPV